MVKKALLEYKNIVVMVVIMAIGLFNPIISLFLAIVLSFLKTNPVFSLSEEESKILTGLIIIIGFYIGALLIVNYVDIIKNPPNLEDSSAITSLLLIFIK